MNRDVARYAREHGFDLREYLERNWPRIGPALAGKLHLSCGESDGNFLNLALYLLQDFLENTTAPYYNGSFEFGRSAPLNGFGNDGTSIGDGPQTNYHYNVAFNAVYTLNPRTIANLNYGVGRRNYVRFPFSQGFDMRTIGMPAATTPWVVEGWPVLAPEGSTMLRVLDHRCHWLPAGR
jgi:hypothetical protein